MGREPSADCETCMEENRDLQMTMYTLQTLYYKGISVSDTVRTSVTTLIHWYEITQEKKHIELALLQLQAAIRMGECKEPDQQLYKRVFELAGWTAYDQEQFMRANAQKVRLTKTQVRSMIGKWSSSQKNPMTIGQVVDDIMDKVRNKKDGQYYYRYERSTYKAKGGSGHEDVYKLVVEGEHSCFWNLRQFKCYVFQN